MPSIFTQTFLLQSKSLVDINALLSHKKNECGDEIVWGEAGRRVVKGQRARG